MDRLLGAGFPVAATPICISTTDELEPVVIVNFTVKNPAPL